MKTFAELFSEYVKRVGVSDTELARAMGVRRQTIFRWREGLTRSPRHREDVLILARKLRLTPEETDQLLLAAGFPPESPDAPPVTKEEVVGQEQPPTIATGWPETGTSFELAAKAAAPAERHRQQWLKMIGGVMLLVITVGAIVVGVNLRQPGKSDLQLPATPSTDSQKSISKEPTKSETPAFERTLLTGETPRATSTPPATSGGTPTPTFDRTLMGGATPVGADIPPAEVDETLILVTHFANYAEEQVGYNVAGRVVETLEQEIREAGLENTRVVIWSETIGLRRYALQAGQAVTATLIIYGEYDLERVAVQFAHPAAERDFVKAGLLYKVNDAEALSAVINTDLPHQARSLALLALGQIYLGQDRLDRAIHVLEQARQNLENEPLDDQTWGTLNFYLGLAYDHSQPPQLDAAIAAYSEALAVQPDLFAARLNRSAAYHLRQKPGDLHLALADANEVVNLVPNWATAYERRGVAYALLSDYAQATADFETVITRLEEEPPGEAQQAKLAQRLAWLEALRAGENPFTPEVLSELQKQ